MEAENLRKRLLNGAERISESDSDTSEISRISRDMRGDGRSITLLFFLYVLQGIPLGLSSAIPMYLQNRGASYRQQAEFSFVSWPFSLKLLWAPIVDSVFITNFGRRKSWLIPIQYLMGIFMLFLSANVDRWLGDGSSELLCVNSLTFFFFCLNFFAATQDIAVDGWALTILKRENVGYASTCNSVGQTTGYFLGYVVFIGLESAEFCNTFLRSEPSPEGIVTLPGFLYFWAWIFIITTTVIAIFKSETNVRNSEEPPLGIKETYQLLWNVTKLPAIRTFALVLLTSKIGFSACDAVSSLKLIDAGVPKDKLALLAVPMVPLQIVLPLIISKYTVGPRPMDVYLKAFPYRLVCGLVAPIIVWITPSLIHNGVIPYHYYAMILIMYSFHQITLYSMFVAIMAFFAKISDPAVGGTYMTMLNTLANLGGNWPATVALSLVESLTFKTCVGHEENTCFDQDDIKACSDVGSSCATVIDGYYVESIACFIFGFLWLQWGRTKINELQMKQDHEWKGFSRITR